MGVERRLSVESRESILARIYIHLVFIIHRDLDARYALRYSIAVQRCHSNDNGKSFVSGTIRFSGGTTFASAICLRLKKRGRRADPRLSSSSVRSAAITRESLARSTVSAARGREILFRRARGCTRFILIVSGLEILFLHARRLTYARKDRTTPSYIVGRCHQ